MTSSKNIDFNKYKNYFEKMKIFSTFFPIFSGNYPNRTEDNKKNSFLFTITFLNIIF